MVGPRERWENSQTVLGAVSAVGGEVLAMAKVPFDQVGFKLPSPRTVTCSSVGRAFARKAEGPRFIFHKVPQSLFSVW